MFRKEHSSLSDVKMKRPALLKRTEGNKYTVVGLYKALTVTLSITLSP